MPDRGIAEVLITSILHTAVVLLYSLTTQFTVLHELYIITFSIFYGVMLHTLKGIRAFDTSSAFTGNAKPLRRFVLSIVFLNFLPFIHFSMILLYLLQNLELSIYSILVVFGLSIGIFGFDKIFHAILSRYRNSLYTTSELESILRNYDNAGRKFSFHYLQNLVPGLLYIFVPLGFLIYGFNWIIGVVIIVASIVAGFVTWYRWKGTMITPKVDERPSI